MPERSSIRLFSRAILLACLALSTARAQSGEEDDFKLARNLYRDAGDYATAAELFAEFLRNYPQSPQRAEARLMLARAYKNSGRCERAILAFEDFYQEHPEHIEGAAARRERAECLSAEGQYLQAARAFEEVQRRFSASEYAPRALLEAAANYTQAQDLGQAAHTYGRIIAEYPTSAAVHGARYRLGVLLFAAGQAEQALRRLGEIAATRPPPEEAPQALLLSGRIELFLGNRESAAGHFAGLQQRFAGSAQADSAYLEQALFLYGQRLFSQAGDAYQEAHRKIAAPELKRHALLGLADARRHSRQTREALEHYAALLKELQPDHPLYLSARLGQAIALGRAGQFAAAVGLFQQLIQLGEDLPQAVDALRELGVLYQERGDHSRAITWYRRYLQAADRAADAESVRFALAELYAATGSFEEAVSIYRQLAESRGALAGEAQYGLARAFEQSDRPREALREYVAFLELFPASRLAEGARRRVEYLSEFTVVDQAALSRALQQAWLRELSGTPRQLVQLEVARTLYQHHDFEAAARAFEHYAAAYRGGPYSAEAQYLLAESLLRLGRQRQLEERLAAADSLRHLALQEHRILARQSEDEWAQRARIRLVETEAETGADSLHYRTLEAGFAALLQELPAASPHRDLVLLRLAEARRHLGEGEPARLDGAIALYRQLRHQYPASQHSAQALFGLGMALARKGELAAAVDSLERVLQNYADTPLSGQVLFELGQLLLRRDRPQEAAARLQELRWGYPAFPERRAAQLLLADTHYRLGDFAEAASLYRQLVEGRSAAEADGRLSRRLARAHYQLGEHARALEAYRQLLAENPAPSALDSIYFDEAVLLVHLGREEEAIARFLKVRDEFARSPLAPQAAARAGHLLFALERYEPAHRAYAPLLAGTQDPQVYGQAVLALFRLQRFAEAREAAKDFSKRFDKDAEWKVRFRLEEGQYHLARREYNRALDLFRDIEKEGGENAGEGAYLASLALWEKNAATPSEEDAARALDAQVRFIKNYPRSPRLADVYLRLANYHFALHNYLQAAGAYKRVLEAAPSAPLAREAIWKLLKSYQGAHEYDEAHRVAEALLREFPDHPQTRQVQLELGIILKEKGQYAQAIGRLEKVLEWAEGNDASEARFYIGESYQNMGEYRKAIEAYYRVSYHGAEGFSQWITSADWQRAKCHESLGELATAISVYQRIVQREGSTSPQGSLAQEQIAALRRRLSNL